MGRIVHSGKIDDVLVDIFFEVDKETKRKKYFVRYDIPEHRLEDFKKLVSENNIVDKQNPLKIVKRSTQKGDKFYIYERCKKSEVLKIINELDIDNFNKESKQSNKKPNEKLFRKAKKAICLVLATAFIYGTVSYIQNYKKIPTDGGSSQQITGTIIDENPEDSEKIENPDDKRRDFDKIKAYDELTYKTYQDEKGNVFVELADVVDITNSCFENIKKELEEYNASVTEDKRYKIDFSKFDSSIFAGVWMRESSNSIPYNESTDKFALGPFQMSKGAVQEANEIALKLSRESVIENIDDYYNPIKACRVSIYYYIRLFEILVSKGLNPNIITPEMVIDSYRYGQKDIVNEVINGTYVPHGYSEDVIYYAIAYNEIERTDDINEKFLTKIRKFLNARTNGSPKIDYDSSDLLSKENEVLNENEEGYQM